MGDAGALLNGAITQSVSPDSLTLRSNSPLPMDSGAALAPLTIAYQTYGALNAAKSNALLLCHALTGDQHVANAHPVTGRPGWWETMVGPGRPFDTDRFFIICSNVLGGCMGSTGPASLNPETGEPYGLDFPIVTIADMVRAQALLIDHLGIETLLCVAGGSMGGMQVLQWAATYPDRVFAALPIATAARHSSQNIAFHEVGRQAIMADPDWRHGRYLVEGTRPGKGLAVARMSAHITYLSESALHRKFGRNLQNRAARTFSFDADFQVESYLRHQGDNLRRTLRSQLLSLHDAGDGLFRPRRGLRRLAGERLQRLANPVLRRLVHLRLAVSHERLARHRSRAERRRRFGFLRRDRDRSRA